MRSEEIYCAYKKLEKKNSSTYTVNTQFMTDRRTQNIIQP